jgi:serine/threonine-protein kinase
MSESAVDRVRIALPGYEIGGEIARGGFGVVLFGTHLGLQRKVAIKLLPTEVAHEEGVRHRFAAEARLMAGIDHPHVVPVYDYVENEDVCLFVMEYLPNGTVLDRFTSHGFDPGSAIGVALACASALEAAHSNGVLHRDVKPANLMFTANGTVKLSDFGIAKLASGDGVKTRAGYVLGTALYIAPEQVLGNPITPATDIYGLATTLYQLLSGTLPFPTDVDSTTTYIMHAHGRPTPLTRVAPKVPSPLADVVMRGLATDPSNRWRTAEEFGVALAAAATRCWGRNWLAQAGVPVLGNDSIKAATAAISSPAVGATPWPAAPTVPSRPRGAVVDGDSTSPRVPYIVAGVLGLAAIVLALIGLGSPPRGGDLQPGMVTIAGIDPVTAEDVEIDMTNPIDVTVAGVPGDAVALAENVLGGTIGNNDAPLISDEGRLTAELEPPNPYIVAGRMTGELRISDGSDTTASFRFGMRSTQSAATTAFAGGVLFLALFAIAYIESFTRTLRRGRNQISARVGLPIAAGALAVAMVGAIWIVVGREPTAATLVSCALIGAAAGASATIAAVRHGVMNNRNRRSQRTPRPSKASGRTEPPTKAIGKTPRPKQDGDNAGATPGGPRRNKGTKFQRG